MFKKTVIAVLILLLSGLIVSAQGVDDEGNPNDPTTNDRANACYDGGSMEGKCDTDWEWTCGWHVIRLDTQNEESRAEFPSGCISLLPPLIQEEVSDTQVDASVPSGACESAGSTVYFDFGGSYFLPAGSIAYSNSACTIILYTTTVLVVYAPAPFDALTLCNLNGTYSSVLPFNDVYECNL